MLPRASFRKQSHFSSPFAKFILRKNLPFVSDVMNKGLHHLKLVYSHLLWWLVLFGSHLETWLLCCTRTSALYYNFSENAILHDEKVLWRVVPQMSSIFSDSEEGESTEKWAEVKVCFKSHREQFKEMRWNRPYSIFQSRTWTSPWSKFLLHRKLRLMKGETFTNGIPSVFSFLRCKTKCKAFCKYIIRFFLRMTRRQCRIYCFRRHTA